MPGLPIAKTHGSRNDILVIDGTPDEHFASPAAVQHAVELLCDRERGLGADGVYFVKDDGDGTARAWFFNPDGSESLLCGNGMRCAGRLLLDRHQAESVSVHTGPYTFTVRDAGTTVHGVREVAVELPPVDFAPGQPIIAGSGPSFIDQPLAAYHPARRVTALAVPNSHLVSVIDTYEEAELVETGRRVADTPSTFPVGANVSFVLPLTSDEVFIHTYERGAGLTPSCGSGNSASRAVLSRLGRVDPGHPVLIRNPGGVARSWLQSAAAGSTTAASGPAWQPVLEGNATVVYRTELDPALLLNGSPLPPPPEEDTTETSAFAALTADNLKSLRESGVHPSPVL
ncbi:diaminopimelate epimerase [Streptomyces sp. ODS28]|uniref:diaminopimelate epimerase n=1 Tax=Streptomyces sp. ODS28 TaxID=3136688 RepID=UPI0031EA24B0